MAENSKIEWCDNTHNFWIGCTKVSQACDFCYAERFGYRQHVAWGKGQARRRTSPGNWQKPFAWNREAAQTGIRIRVFSSSLSDIFDTEVSEQWRFDAFKVIDATPNLDWLLLTKRTKSACERLSDPSWWEKAIGRVPDELHLPQVWFGTTVENQKMADMRIPYLVKSPAAVRFVSMEPVFEDIRLPADFLALGKKAWCITGGESGPKARPSHPDWFRSLRDQCGSAGVPHLFKQYGDWGPIQESPDVLIASGEVRTVAGEVFAGRGNAPSILMGRVGKHEAGRILDGRTWDELPEGPFFKAAAQGALL